LISLLGEKDKLIKLSKELGGSYVAICDMRDPSAIKKMIRKVNKHYKGIDILINNAGQGYEALIENIKLSTFTKLFNLNLVGPLVAMQQVIPIMRRKGKGSIINISSGTTFMVVPNMAAYSSSKRALTGISLIARQELKSDNISVSTVYPFKAATNFIKNTIRDRKLPDWSEYRDRDRGFKLPSPDSAEFVAEKIVQAIETEEAEVFAHDWMKR